MPRGQTSEDAIRIMERRVKVWELRKTGMEYRQIADYMLRKHPELCSPKYGEQNVYQDVMSTMKKTREHMREDAQDVLLMTLKRLDAMLFSVWRAAISGDYKAIDRALMIMRQQTKLMGLDKLTVQLETDWRKEAEEKGLPASEVFEEMVKEMMKHEQGIDNSESGLEPATVERGYGDAERQSADTDAERGLRGSSEEAQGVDNTVAPDEEISEDLYE